MLVGRRRAWCTSQAQAVGASVAWFELFAPAENADSLARFEIVLLCRRWRARQTMPRPGGRPRRPATIGRILRRPCIAALSGSLTLCRRLEAQPRDEHKGERPHVDLPHHLKISNAFLQGVSKKPGVRTRADVAGLNPARLFWVMLISRVGGVRRDATPRADRNMRGMPLLYVAMIVRPHALPRHAAAVLQR